MLNKYNYFQPLIKERGLIRAMVQRDVVSRYKGSVLGLFWSFLNPLMMLGIYTFVFQYIFKAKWGDDREITAHFASIMFAGLLMHMWFAEVATKAIYMIIGNVNYVKKVIFPLDILGWNIIFSSTVQFLCGFIVLIFVTIGFGGAISGNILLIPLVIIPFMFFLIGCVYLLSTLSVFFRDVEQVVNTSLTVLLFTSTIFFPIEMVPSFLKNVIKLNPLTIPVETFRGVVFGMNTINYIDVAIYTLCTFLFSIISYAFFVRLKRIFSDVI